MQKLTSAALWGWGMVSLQAQVQLVKLIFETSSASCATTVKLCLL